MLASETEKSYGLTNKDKGFFIWLINDWAFKKAKAFINRKNRPYEK
jgi:hypothetical protein